MGTNDLVADIMRSPINMYSLAAGWYSPVIIDYKVTSGGKLREG
jgi:hypothetical protein